MLNGVELRFQQALRMTISNANHLEGWQSALRCAQHSGKEPSQQDSLGRAQGRVYTDTQMHRPAKASLELAASRRSASAPTDAKSAPASAPTQHEQHARPSMRHARRIFKNDPPL
jgi:hypothetical protein